MEHPTPIPREEARRVLVVAGGTGGHIAPALAVGSVLRTLYGSGVVVRYLTGSRAIEREAFSAAEEFPDTIACDGVPRLSPAALPQALRYVKSVVDAFGLLRRFRPHVILATGGYVCAPVLTAARLMKIPYHLHESNAVAGRVTRLFARRARTVFVAHDKARGRLDGAPCRAVGTPVRRALLEQRRGAEALAHFDFRPDRPTLLLLGGSQGAQALNEAMLDSLPLLAERFVDGLQVIWACGPLNHKTVSQQLEAMSLANVDVRLYDFLKEMHLAYAAADLVVSRAGASSLAEITALALPAILIPYPHAKDNHQHENALSVVQAGAARLLVESELTGRSLAQVAGDLLEDRERLARLSEAARTVAAPQCAETIARVLMDGRDPISSDVVALSMHHAKKLTA